MRIADILTPSRVLADLEATTRDEVLRAIAHVFVREGPRQTDEARVFALLVQRERAGSTGVGHSIAIPHTKVPGLNEPVACFARSKEGVDFSSLDGQPTHLIMALFAPEGRASLHLKALARASRLFKDASFRTRLLQANDAEELWSLILEQDRTLQS